MYVYKIVRPAQDIPIGYGTTPEQVLGYYLSRDAVNRHIEDSTDLLFEVFKIEVRALYRPEDPAPEHTKVYGPYRSVGGVYSRGWLDNPSAID